MSDSVTLRKEPPDLRVRPPRRSGTFPGPGPRPQGTIRPAHLCVAPFAGTNHVQTHETLTPSQSSSFVTSGRGTPFPATCTRAAVDPLPSQQGTGVRVAGEHPGAAPGAVGHPGALNARVRPGPLAGAPWASPHSRRATPSLPRTAPAVSPPGMRVLSLRVRSQGPCSPLTWGAPPSRGTRSTAAPTR